MVVHCTHCGAQNPAKARFCGLCGTPLGVTTAAPVSAARRDLVLLMIVAALLLSMVVAVTAARRARRVREGHIDFPEVRRGLVLSEAKSDAFYDLIRPSDIAVVVGRGAGGLFVEGSPAEVEVLTDFVEILNRVESLPRYRQAERVDQLRPTWSTRRSYRLSRSKAKSLTRILAFDNVPVLVSRRGSRVTVDAAPDDQKTIARVVDVLLGRRF